MIKSSSCFGIIIVKKLLCVNVISHYFSSFFFLIIFPYYFFSLYFVIPSSPTIKNHEIKHKTLKVFPPKRILPVRYTPLKSSTSLCACIMT